MQDRKTVCLSFVELTIALIENMFRNDSKPKLNLQNNIIQNLLYLCINTDYINLINLEQEQDKSKKEDQFNKVVEKPESSNNNGRNIIKANN